MTIQKLRHVYLLTKHHHKIISHSKWIVVLQFHYSSLKQRSIKLVNAHVCFHREEGRLSNFLYQVEVMMMHWFSWMLLLAKYEALQGHPQIPRRSKVWKWWSDTAITSRHSRCNQSLIHQNPNFWHSRKQHKLSTPNHPKRNPNYVIAKAKTKTPPKLINDPTQFDNFYWRKNSMKKEYSWPCEKLSLISNVHPLAIIDHPLYLILKSFLSVHLYVKWTFTWRNSWDVNHNPFYDSFEFAPSSVFCLEKTWYKIWCKLYGCLD